MTFDLKQEKWSI